jgi:hypothetical protein
LSPKPTIQQAALVLGLACCGHTTKTTDRRSA